MTSPKSTPELPGPQIDSPPLRDLLAIWRSAEERDPAQISPAALLVLEALAKEGRGAS